jgi:two-component system CheB/CheR fusion protein
MPKLATTASRYGCAVFFIVLTTAVRYPLDRFLDADNASSIYYAAFAFNAWFCGLGPSLAAYVLSGMAVAYFIVPPAGSGALTSLGVLIGFAIFALIGMGVNLLVWSLREAVRHSEANEAEARRALEAERVQRTRLRTALASIADAVITADAQGRVTGLNPTAEQLTGWTADQATGRPLVEVFRTVDEPSRRTDEMALAEVLQKGAILRSSDYIVLASRDGRSRPVEHCTAPIQEGGRITGMILVFRDVTERFRAEQALREADRRKDEFLAMLAHELRNPLAPIVAALQLMKRHRGGPDLEEDRAMAERQVRHMARLIDDLMDVSRISRGKVVLRKEVVDLKALVARAAETGRPLLEERRHQFAVTLPDAPVLVKADPTRLEQVLTNLLSNASKYTDPGGRIRLTAGREGGWAVVRVRDTGIGIEPRMLPEVFGLFVQVERRLDRSRSGLGIGLSLVKSLVEMHGGSVSAHSEGPGRGSEFVIRLPALERVPKGGGRPFMACAEASREMAGRRILVVDDNVDAADGLGRLLSRVWGQEVRVVYDGPAALVSAESFRPEVVLLDLGLPGMDGYEVARRLRGEPEFADVLLVAVTGWGQDSDRQMSKQAGFDHHLVKPVDLERLRGLLTTAAVAVA